MSAPAEPDNVLLAIYRMVGETQGQVKMLVDQGKIQDDRIADQEKRLSAKDDALDVRMRAVEKVAAPAIEYDTRLRAVENRHNWYAGAIAAIGAGLTYLGFKISFHG